MSEHEAGSEPGAVAPARHGRLSGFGQADVTLLRRVADDYHGPVVDTSILLRDLADRIAAVLALTDRIAASCRRRTE